MTPREEKFVDETTEIMKILYASGQTQHAHRLCKAIMKFNIDEPKTSLEIIDGSEAKDARDDRDEARERWEDAQR